MQRRNSSTEERKIVSPLTRVPQTVPGLFQELRVESLDLSGRNWRPRLGGSGLDQTSPKNKHSEVVVVDGCLLRNRPTDPLSRSDRVLVQKSSPLEETTVQVPQAPVGPSSRSAPSLLYSRPPRVDVGVLSDTVGTTGSSCLRCPLASVSPLTDSELHISRL